MNALLKILSALTLIAGITFLEGRRVAPVGADDCAPKDLDVRPPEKIKPPKPETPDGGVAKAGCACGCACEGGCSCHVNGPCSAACDCAGYATMRARAIHEGRPLVVLVGGATFGLPDDPSTELFGDYCPACATKAKPACVEKTMRIANTVLVCKVTTLPGFSGKCIVVSAPKDGQLWWLKTLESGATARAVQDAAWRIPAPVARQAVPREPCASAALDADQKRRPCAAQTYPDD